MDEHTVTVTETIERTPTCVSVRMERPDGFFYRAGQWGLFTPLTQENQESKPLSFSSSPTEPFLEFTKRISGSGFSRAIKFLAPGDQVRFRGPSGNLVLDEKSDGILFVAGGIGITPVRSILRYMEDCGDRCDRLLLYANRNQEEIAFREELEGMAAGKPRFHMVHILEKPIGDWEGHAGFITRGTIREQVPDLNERTIYLCGPPLMVSCLEDIFYDLEIPMDRIKKEKLIGYDTML